MSDQDNFSLISLNVLIACLLSNIWILWGEIAHLSLLGGKAIKILSLGSGFVLLHPFGNSHVCINPLYFHRPLHWSLDRHSGASTCISPPCYRKHPWSLSCNPYHVLWMANLCFVCGKCHQWHVWFLHNNGACSYVLYSWHYWWIRQELPVR